MKTTITTTAPTQIAKLNDIMQQAGQAANETAARHAYADHTARKADNTIRRKIADLALFETFLQSVGIPAAGLYDNPHAWRGITWGIVEAFRNSGGRWNNRAQWQFRDGIGTPATEWRLRYFLQWRWKRVFRFWRP